MNYIFVAALRKEVDFSILKGRENIRFLYTGVGKTESAISLMKFLYETTTIDFKDLHIINVGTCGSNKYQIGDLISVLNCRELGNDFVSTTYHLHDLSPIIPFPCFRDAVLSSDFFISSKTLNENTFSDFTTDHNCFDMELAALARVCHKMGIKLSSFKVVSDTLESDVVDWESTLAILSPKLKKLVELIVQ